MNQKLLNKIGSGWPIIFGLVLILAGRFIVVSTTTRSYHFYSEEMDVVVGSIAIIIGILAVVLQFYLWYKTPHSRTS